MTDHDKQEPIAIVGAACRLAGNVTSLETLWDMISRVKTGHGEIPKDRWNSDDWFHPDPDRKGGITTRHGYFLQQDVSHFDAPFFSTTSKEAAAMDPMKRLLLEVAYESIENAGVPVESLVASETGCYVGCMTNDYEMMSLHDIYDVGHAAASANSEAMTANRISWFFGLQGPSLTLDTACSSSLYALHLACQSLKLGETNMALVAGVNLILNPDTMHLLSAMHMLSPEGICHTFDERANGYGRGEGIGCLVVKRLSDALRDGDTIRAIIRGTGANADGKTPSVTQPSPSAQAELIKRTYEAAGLAQESTQYFESHGTGTPVGDPIEMTAIASTLGASRKTAGLGPLYVGSIKPNVGHTEGCSGLAGVFKAIACLEKGMLVPTYGVESINRRLKLDEWNLALPHQVMQWPGKGQRRVSINSFGFGGANAHVILDDTHHYLAQRGLIGNHCTTVLSDNGCKSGISTIPCLTPRDKGAMQLFVFSTKDQAGIKRIDDDPNFFCNLAYTLASRRSHLDFRTHAVASTAADLRGIISTNLPISPRSSRQNGSLVFVFTGQGAQWPGMGRQLLRNAVFKQSIEESQRCLENLGCGWNVMTEIQKTANSRLNLPEYSQTLCTVLQVALVDLLRHWGVVPKATVGHSSGEIAAAYAASMIMQADAVKIAYVRGLSSAAVSQEGAMLAVGLSEKECHGFLSRVAAGSAVVACVNSPSSTTLSGDVDAINRLESDISSSGKFTRRLKVKTAYHSPHMSEVSHNYLQQIGTVTHPEQGGNKTLMFSSLTGRLVESCTELDAQYWVSNMQAPVQFSAALTSLLTHRADKFKKMPLRWSGFLEVGPHAALQGPVQQVISVNANKSAKEALYLAVILRNKDAMETSLAAVGQLWAAGHMVDLQAVNGMRGSKALTHLPPYPWNHAKGFWYEPYMTRSNRFSTGPRTDLLGVATDMHKAEPQWRNHLRISENPWMEDHKVTGTILYPAAGMLVMALEGALQMATSPSAVHGFRYRDVSFERGLVVTLGDQATVETRLSLLPHKSLPDQFQFTVYSTTGGTSWTKHCSGSISVEYVQPVGSEVEDQAADHTERMRHTALCEKLQAEGEPVDVASFYDHLEQIGMEYGPLFRNVMKLSAVPQLSAATADIVVPDTVSSMPAGFEFPHVMHPATMDSIFHMVLAVIDHGHPITEAAVPFSIDEMFVAADQPHGAGSLFKVYGQLTHTRDGGREMVADLIASDEAMSAAKLTLTGFTLRQVTSSTVNAGDVKIKQCAQLHWIEDVDFIRNEADLRKLGDDSIKSVDLLAAWLDRLAHKKSKSRVLILIDHEPSPDACHALKDLCARHGRDARFNKISVASPSTAVLDSVPRLVHSSAFAAHQWNFIEENKPPSDLGMYDVIVVLDNQSESSELLSQLRALLLPQGYLTAQQKAGMKAEMSQVFQEAGLVRPITACGLFISPVSPLPIPSLPHDVYLLLPAKQSEELSGLVSALATTFASLDINTHEVHLSDASELTGRHVISLLEFTAPIIYSWTASDFVAFKNLVSVADHVFWLSRGDALNAWTADGTGTFFAPAQGLLRVLRNEYPLVTLPHLDVSPTLNPIDSHRTLLDVWKRSLVSDSEMEFAVDKNGSVFIPRAVSDDVFDAKLEQSVAAAGGRVQPVRSRLGDMNVPALPAKTLGDGEYLWVEDLAAKKIIGSCEVEIRVEAVCLREPDEDGHLSALGYEAVGTVTRCGTHVKSVILGQRVVMLQVQGALKTDLRQNESLVARVPVDIKAQEAVTMVRVFTAAQYALLEIARLQKDQSVLVHSAASAYGQAVIQVAQHIQADVFAMVTTRAEKQMLMDRYGIPSNRIYDSALRTFLTAIKEATNQQGVDVILSSKPGPAVMPSADILVELGHFIGFAQKAGDLTPPTNQRNIVCASINVAQLEHIKPKAASRLFRRTFELLADSETFKPITPSVSFSITDLSRALSTLHDDPATPIAVSLTDADASVLTVATPSPKLALDSEGTYVLAGGLGSLGLDIARMMATHGAGHLVFLSRSGGSSKHHAALESLRTLGTRADAYSCDISDPNSTSAVFEQLREAGCKVRGVLQAAMVLEDAIFDNMTHDQWQRAFLPKTRGSHNLLSQLALHGSSEKSKPFFILLSSITGIIGNAAQANYAAGNTFEDALAQHAWAHLDIAATSIDVGAVIDSTNFTANGAFGDDVALLHRYSHGWHGLRTTLEELRIVLVELMRRAQDSESAPATLILGLGDKLERRPGAMGFQQDHKFDLRVSSGTTDSSSSESLTTRLVKAESLDEAAAVVEEDLKALIAASSGVSVDEVDAQKPLFDFGVDSLKAVEIRNRSLRELQSDISVFELLSATPLADLALKIAAKSALVKINGMVS